MNERSQNMPCEEDAGAHANPLAELQLLLDRGIEEAHSGNLAAVAALAQQAGQLVENLTSNRVVETAGFKTAKSAVQDSYRKLLLTLAAANQDIAGQLSSVRQGRKLVHAYRRNAG